MTSGQPDENSMSADGDKLRSLEDLRREIVRLQQRIDALEQQAAPARSNADEAQQSSADDELLAVISAALAAYFGVQPHIRQIRLVGGASWAQQGRVTIQASHAVHVRLDQE
jgi:methylmalonyl-CoA carboxyltransferase large subunit